MININGVVYTGRSVSVMGGKVVIDGQVINIEEKVINVRVEGDLKKLEVGACQEIQVVGNVDELSCTSGDVAVDGNVTGSVSSVSGDIKVKGSVSGNCKTVSGDINRG